MARIFPNLVPFKAGQDPNTSWRMLERWTAEVRDMFTRASSIDWSLIDDITFDATHTQSNTFTLDSDDTGGNVDLVFGITVNKYLRHTGTQFQLNDDLLINSDITISSGSILSTSGTITFGNENLNTLGIIEAGNFNSTCLAGTAPYACISTNLNTNLNADLIDGYHATGLSGLVDHTALLNLNSTSYYHLTQTNHTDLTDAGDSLLHYHATDRDSANFTGTNWDDLTDAGATTLHKHSHLNIDDIGTINHADIDIHIGSTGSAVHGLGTISTEAAGASGSFTSADAKTITVVNGVITTIV